MAGVNTNRTSQQFRRNRMTQPTTTGMPTTPPVLRRPASAIYRDVLNAGHKAGLSGPVAIACATAACSHDWRAVRRALIAAGATGADVALRNAYYRR